MTFKVTKSLVMCLMFVILACGMASLYGYFSDNKLLKSWPLFIVFGCLWLIHKYWPSKYDSMPWNWKK